MWKCSTALIKLQKPLPNADGRKIPPFPGQPCPSSCSSLRAGPGIPGLERGWEKQRDDPATEGVFFPLLFFHLCLPGKPPASRAGTGTERLQHPPQPRRGMSAIPAVGDTETQGQLEKLFDMGQWRGRAGCYRFFWLNKS